MRWIPVSGRQSDHECLPAELVVYGRAGTKTRHRLKSNNNTDRIRERSDAAPRQHETESAAAQLNKLMHRFRVFFQQILRSSVQVIDSRRFRVDAQVVIQSRIDLRKRHRT